LDDYNYNARGGNPAHSVLLPPLPTNPYTNPTGYATPQGTNYPFENTEMYPVYGDRNPLARAAEPPAGSDDGQWHPSVPRQQMKRSSRGWFGKWGNRNQSGEYRDAEKGRPGRRSGTSWFEDD
jgi:hypothetical protein